MTTHYRLDKLFGPVGTSAGIVLMVVGLIVCYFSLTGLILVLTGAFVGLTSTATTIDGEKKRLRFSTDIFGILPIGQWIPIHTDMKIGIRKSKKVWRAYSRSNRIIDIDDNDYRVMLFDSHGKEMMPILKTDSLDSAKLRLEKLNKELGIGVICAKIQLDIANNEHSIHSRSD